MKIEATFTYRDFVDLARSRAIQPMAVMKQPIEVRVAGGRVHFDHPDCCFRLAAILSALQETPQGRFTIACGKDGISPSIEVSCDELLAALHSAKAR